MGISLVDERGSAVKTWELGAYNNQGTSHPRGPWGFDRVWAVWQLTLRKYLSGDPEWLLAALPSGICFFMSTYRFILYMFNSNSIVKTHLSSILSTWNKRRHWKACFTWLFWGTGKQNMKIHRDPIQTPVYLSLTLCDLTMLSWISIAMLT